MMTVKKSVSCALPALLLLTLLAESEVKGQVIPVPVEQLPIFLGHFDYPTSVVTLKFDYSSPTQCPVSESSKLADITIDVPRGGTLLNALEIASYFSLSYAFHTQYVPGLGYFLSEINNVPPSNASSHCVWRWTSHPLIYSTSHTRFTINDVYIPAFFLSNANITFSYQHAASFPPLNSIQPMRIVVPADNLTVDYQLISQGETCNLSQYSTSIPAIPLPVTLQVGSSALNVMEQAAVNDPTLDFTVSNSFGIFYFPVSIANVSLVFGCTWCMKYLPPNSSETIVPDLDLSNFVIPVTGITLHFEYTNNCTSTFQVALAHNNVTYFRERGIIKSKQEHSLNGEESKDQQKSSYSISSLLLVLVTTIASLYFCTRYFL